MEKSKRLEIKVGVFMAVGLVLIATLLLEFSKGSANFRHTYEVRLHAPGVGGIKPRAYVLLAGVQVGTVADIKLAADGKSVTMLLSIYSDTKIYHDARFVIETANLLGDQYVGIVPTTNTLPTLVDGADVTCEEPFDLQEVEQTAAGLLARINGTAEKLDGAVTDFRREVLNQRTLTNVDLALNNIRAVSEQALSTVSNLNHLVLTNTPQVERAVSNIVLFSHQLNGLADSANALLATNGAQINIATRNIADSTATLKGVINGVQAGNGLAGTILENETLSSNVQAIVANVAITTSNLNKRGLWGILWAHKHPETTPSGGASEPATK